MSDVEIVVILQRRATISWRTRAELGPTAAIPPGDVAEIHRAADRDEIPLVRAEELGACCVELASQRRPVRAIPGTESAAGNVVIVIRRDLGSAGEEQLPVPRGKVADETF